MDNEEPCRQNGQCGVGGHGKGKDELGLWSINSEFTFSKGSDEEAAMISPGINLETGASLD